MVVACFVLKEIAELCSRVDYTKVYVCLFVLSNGLTIEGKPPVQGLGMRRTGAAEGGALPELCAARNPVYTRAPDSPCRLKAAREERVFLLL